MERDPDDDLIVELDEVEELRGVPPPEDEEIEEPELRTPLVDRLPDAEDFEQDEEPVQTRVARKDDDADDEPAPDFDESRVIAERQAREVRAESLWRETQAYAENYRLQRSQADLGLNIVSEKIEGAYQALAVAEDNGDTAAKIAAQRQLDELKTLRGQIEQAKAQVPDPDQFLQQGRARALALRDAPSEESQGVAVGANLRARTPLAAEWAKANSSWMKTNDKANDFVIRQSKALVESGWAPNERGFYTELSRLVQARFPSLKVAKPTAQKGAAVQRRSSPVAPSRPSSGAPSQRQNASATRVRLDASEQAKMKRFNLDPSNADHRKHYAKVVLSRQRRDAMQGA